ncbi:hypothetical protein LINPERPRIM_LOCUS7574 [Linum perenne]
MLAHHRHTLDFGFHVNCIYSPKIDIVIWNDHVGTCFAITILLPFLYPKFFLVRNNFGS